jgi:hypothetical protein
VKTIQIDPPVAASSADTLLAATPRLSHVLFKATLIGIASGALSAFFYLQSTDPIFHIPRSNLALLPGATFGVTAGLLTYLWDGHRLSRAAESAAGVFVTWLIVLGIIISTTPPPKERLPLEWLRLPFLSPPPDTLPLGNDIQFRIILCALVGSLGTWLSVTSGPPTRSLTTAGLVLVAGTLPVFIAPTEALIFILWQGGVATALAYGLCTQTRESLAPYPEEAGGLDTS